MRTNADITLYNKYFDKVDRTDSYKKTILYGVFWQESKGSNVIKSGLTNADSLTVFIPHKDHIDTYQEPKVFATNQSGWTLQEGDIVVRGAIEEEFTTVADLEKKYDHVHMITSVDNMNFGSPHMRHWEVGGK